MSAPLLSPISECVYISPMSYVPTVMNVRGVHLSAHLFKKATGYNKPNAPNSLNSENLKNTFGSDLGAQTVITVNVNSSPKLKDMYKVIAYKNVKAESRKNAKSPSFSDGFFVV